MMLVEEERGAKQNSGSVQRKAELQSARSGGLKIEADTSPPSPLPAREDSNEESTAEEKKQPLETECAQMCIYIGAFSTLAHVLYWKECISDGIPLHVHWGWLLLGNSSFLAALLFPSGRRAYLALARALLSLLCPKRFE